MFFPNIPQETADRSQLPQGEGDREILLEQEENMRTGVGKNLNYIYNPQSIHMSQSQTHKSRNRKTGDKHLYYQQKKITKDTRTTKQI